MHRCSACAAQNVQKAPPTWNGLKHLSVGHSAICVWLWHIVLSISAVNVGSFELRRDHRPQRVVTRSRCRPRGFGKKSRRRWSPAQMHLPQSQCLFTWTRQNVHVMLLQHDAFFSQFSVKKCTRNQLASRSASWWRSEEILTQHLCAAMIFQLTWQSQLYVTSSLKSCVTSARRSRKLTART